MTALLASEFLKLRTTRALIGFLSVVLLLSAVAAGAQAGAGQLFELDKPEFQRDLVSTAVAAPLIALLLGITSVTVEFRHGTITRTLLVTPRRERVLAAKEIAAFVFGAALAVLAVAVVLVVAIPVLSGQGTSLELDGALAGRIGRIILAAALFGALGAGVGALLQNQTFAMVAALIWVIVLEPLIGVLLGEVDAEGVSDFLPSKALSALDGSADDGLPPALGGLVGLGYVALFAAFGLLRMARRDIT